MNQKLEKYFQHIFCKHSLKSLKGILKAIFSQNNTKNMGKCWVQRGSNSNTIDLSVILSIENEKMVDMLQK